MMVSSIQQINVFLVSIIAGAFCGVFFDFLRSLRKNRIAGEMEIFISDSLFAVFCVGISILMSILFDKGDLRAYQISGELMGLLLYGAFLSHVTMLFLNFSEKIILKIIIQPVVKFISLFLKLFKRLNTMVLRYFRRIKLYFAKKIKNIKRKKEQTEKKIKML